MQKIYPFPRKYSKRKWQGGKLGEDEGDGKEQSKLLDYFFAYCVRTYFVYSIRLGLSSTKLVSGMSSLADSTYSLLLP